MTRKVSLVLVIVAMMAAMAAPAVAGVRATLILTSGERVKGVLVDMGGADFTMLEGGNEVRFAINDVAVIDFVGGGQVPATEVAKMEGSRPVVFQRNGDFLYGRLFDIGGDNPIRLTFNSSDGRFELNSNEVSRIYLRRWDGMPQPGGGGGGGTKPPERPQPEKPAPASGIAVPATTSWIDTGIQVRAGQMVTFSVRGEVILSGDNNDTAGPDGAHNGRYARRGAPSPGLAAGALVGRAGMSAPFGIGSQTQPLQMPSTGSLFLAVNDETPADNRGEFRVTVTIIR
jgi:hypothetical protein